MKGHHKIRLPVIDMSNSLQYLRVPTDGDVELGPIGEGDATDRRGLDRQVSLTAETGCRVRQMNERRRERLNTELLNALSLPDNEQEVKR